MDNTILLNQLYNILFTAAILAGPPLIVATVLGLSVSIMQAITQIQDQSLSQTVKIAAISLVLVFIGGLLAAPLYQASDLIFTDFHKWVE